MQQIRSTVYQHMGTAFNLANIVINDYQCRSKHTSIAQPRESLYPVQSYTPQGL